MAIFVTTVAPAKYRQPADPPNLLTTTLASKDKFYGLAGSPQKDWPNPRGPVWTSEVRAGLTRSVPLNLLGKDRFFAAAGEAPRYDWPNPPPARRIDPSLHQPPPNLLTTTLGRPAGRGLTNDQPNPRGPAWTADARQGFQNAAEVHLIGRDQFFGAAGQGPRYDWPNPRGARPLPVNEPVPNTLVTTLATPAGTPKFQTDWPNPAGAVWSADVRRGFTGSTPLNLLGKDKFFGGAGRAPAYDWPNPRGPLRAADQPLGQQAGSLLVGVLARPVGFAECPGPVVRVGLAGQVPHQPPNLLLGPLAAVPAGTRYDWPNPAAPRWQWWRYPPGGCLGVMPRPGSLLLLRRRAIL